MQAPSAQHPAAQRATSQMQAVPSQRWPAAQLPASQVHVPSTWQTWPGSLHHSPSCAASITQEPRELGRSWQIWHASHCGVQSHEPQSTATAGQPDRATRRSPCSGSHTGVLGPAANTRRTGEIAAGPSGRAWRVCRAAEADAGTKHGERVHEESGLVLTQSLRTPFRPRGAPCTSFQTLPSRAVSAMIPPGDAWQPHDHAGRDMTVARQHAGRGVVRLRAGHH